MRILVTGGAGYIGSHATRALLDSGHDVVVLDNLTTGHAGAVDPRARLVVTDLRDHDATLDALRDVEAVLHFAARSIVSESVAKPLEYWDNNVNGSVTLLRAMARAGVKKLVFSSTAATYGIPRRLPISEDTEQRPINPYGATKLAIEHAIRDLQDADPEFAACVLRYFNVVGCAEGLGEDHHPETHLLPIVLQAASGRRPFVTIFGDDYATEDGTCVRDYVHVEDLVSAHVLALGALEAGDRRVYNVGLGHGHSVRQIVQAVAAVTGTAFETRMGLRREGDPPALVTDPTRLVEDLGWQPTRSLEDAIASSWHWLCTHPNGFEDSP